MQTEKSQLEGERIMLETRFTEFPALSVDPKIGISRPTSENNVLLIFLSSTLKVVSNHSSFLVFLTFYVASSVILPYIILLRTSFGIFHGAACDVTSEI